VVIKDPRVLAFRQCLIPVQVIQEMAVTASLGIGVIILTDLILLPLLVSFVPITPRVEAALRMIPLAIFASMLAVAAIRGGPPEWAGIAAALAAMVWARNDFVAIVAGILVVAGLRYLA